MRAVKLGLCFALVCLFGVAPLHADKEFSHFDNYAHMRFNLDRFCDRVKGELIVVSARFLDNSLLDSLVRTAQRGVRVQLLLGRIDASNLGPRLTRLQGLVRAQGHVFVNARLRSEINSAWIFDNKLLWIKTEMAEEFPLRASKIAFRWVRDAKKRSDFRRYVQRHSLQELSLGDLVKKIDFSHHFHRGDWEGADQVYRYRRKRSVPSSQRVKVLPRQPKSQRKRSEE